MIHESQKLKEKRGKKKRGEMGKNQTKSTST
jgi:hypothetical protein